MALEGEAAALMVHTAGQAEEGGRHLCKRKSREEGGSLACANCWCDKMVI